MNNQSSNPDESSKKKSYPIPRQALLELREILKLPNSPLKQKKTRDVLNTHPALLNAFMEQHERRRNRERRQAQSTNLYVTNLIHQPAQQNQQELHQRIQQKQQSQSAIHSSGTIPRPASDNQTALQQLTPPISLLPTNSPNWEDQMLSTFKSNSQPMMAAIDEHWQQVRRVQEQRQARSVNLSATIPSPQPAVQNQQPQEHILRKQQLRQRILYRQQQQQARQSICSSHTLPLSDQNLDALLELQQILELPCLVEQQARIERVLNTNRELMNALTELRKQQQQPINLNLSNTTCLQEPRTVGVTDAEVTSLILGLCSQSLENWERIRPAVLNS